MQNNDSRRRERRVVRRSVEGVIPDLVDAGVVAVEGASARGVKGVDLDVAGEFAGETRGILGDSRRGGRQRRNPGDFHFE